ncbi:MAG: CBS domain-containing protein, partial [Candidatus Aenigmarchaeota archaeon]|nr:CBS domain-containing protein [Candidatus Aenigmarchaeota archaeon]
YSRYPVYQKEEGNIIGIADVDEILAAVKSGRLKKKMVTVSKKPIFIPENKDIMSLLSEFEGKEASMAIVVDEYGHFMGLVTMDDVLEEIVGDIFDKSKKPHAYIKSIGSGEFLVDGRTPISVLEEHVDLIIEDRGFDTVAGLILKHAGRIPAKGETLKIRNVRFTIEDASPRTVKRVRIKKL